MDYMLQNILKLYHQKLTRTYFFKTKRQLFRYLTYTPHPHHAATMFRQCVINQNTLDTFRKYDSGAT